MKRGRLATLAFGVLLLVLGTVFALQGANVIGGSSLMSGNSDYIYIGGVVAIIGLGVIALEARTKGRDSSAV